MTIENESYEQKFARKINELSLEDKAKALIALRKEEREHKEQELIRKNIEELGHKVITVTKYDNFHIIKYENKDDQEEWYQVYVSGKPCDKVTKDPKMILLIALTHEINETDDQTYMMIAKMLGIKEEN